MPNVEPTTNHIHNRLCENTTRTRPTAQSHTANPTLTCCQRPRQRIRNTALYIHHPRHMEVDDKNDQCRTHSKRRTPDKQHTHTTNPTLTSCRRPRQRIENKPLYINHRRHMEVNDKNDRCRAHSKRLGIITTRTRHTAHSHPKSNTYVLPAPTPADREHAVTHTSSEAYVSEWQERTMRSAESTTNNI